MFATEQLTTVSCYRCGIVFAMPQSYYQDRLKDHDNWHCPNGHVQHFTGKTALQKKADRLEYENARLLRQKELAEKEARYQKGRATRTVNKAKKEAEKVANGTCPCCKRNFKNLRRHMQTKHPKHVKQTKSKGRK